MNEETEPTAAAEDDKNSVSQDPQGPGAIVELPDGTVLGDGESIPTLPVAPAKKTKKPRSIQEALGLPTEPYAVVGGGDTDPVDITKVDAHKISQLFNQRYLRPVNPD